MVCLRFVVGEYDIVSVIENLWNTRVIMER